MPHYPSEIEYSEKYQDDRYEYRHVMLTKDVVSNMRKVMADGLTANQVRATDKAGRKYRLLKDEEWRGLGVQQSRGWEHYEIHTPEPHILLFRRLLGTDPVTGRVDPRLAPQQHMG